MVERAIDRERPTIRITTHKGKNVIFIVFHFSGADGVPEECRRR
jgi:hypothetical protein